MNLNLTIFICHNRNVIGHFSVALYCESQHFHWIFRELFQACDVKFTLGWLCGGVKIVAFLIISPPVEDSVPRRIPWINPFGTSPQVIWRLVELVLCAVTLDGGRLGTEIYRRHKKICFSSVLHKQLSCEDLIWPNLVMTIYSFSCNEINTLIANYVRIISHHYVCH